MPRKPAPVTEQRQPTLVRLRPDLRGHIDLALFSEVEGRLPHGALSDFLNTLLERYFLGSDPIVPYYQAKAHARTD
jgi:hypothetical protein